MLAGRSHKLGPPSEMDTMLLHLLPTVLLITLIPGDTWGAVGGEPRSR